jgi:hypothetical protein
VLAEFDKKSSLKNVRVCFPPFLLLAKKLSISPTFAHHFRCVAVRIAVVSNKADFEKGICKEKNRGISKKYEKTGRAKHQVILHVTTKLLLTPAHNFLTTLAYIHEHLWGLAFVVCFVGHWYITNIEEAGERPTPKQGDPCETPEVHPQG